MKIYEKRVFKTENMEIPNEKVGFDLFFDKNFTKNFTKKFRKTGTFFDKNFWPFFDFLERTAVRKMAFFTGLTIRS